MIPDILQLAGVIFTVVAADRHAAHGRQRGRQSVWQRPTERVEIHLDRRNVVSASSDRRL